MSVKATVNTTTETKTVTIPENHRHHTIGAVVSGGYILVEARVPGGDFEPVMDSGTSAPLHINGTESVSIEEISVEAIRFTPVGATYSACVTSQAAD